MDSRYLDHYSYIDSPVHRLHASMKSGVAVVLLLLCLFIPIGWVTFHTLVVLFLLITALFGRVPLLGLVKRLRWIWLLILIWSLGRFVYPGGWYAALSTFIWMSESLLIVTLLFSTTRFADLLQVLTGMGVPRFLVSAVDLMYRFVFVLSDESQRMGRARLSRTLSIESPAKAWTWRLQPAAIGQLFVRCADRAQRIHSAMMARGWQ